MTEPAIRFDDGAAYERFMGVWSRRAGDAFLDWLAPGRGERWLDVGCGNGAFSALLAERLSPGRLDGIDPSEAQITYARERAMACPAAFRTGDAQALPYAEAAFDQAVMALVIFFVPDPARGVAEMARVTRPGGTVSAYAWDLPGGGFPYAPLQQALLAQGRAPVLPPQAAVAALDALRALWTDAGLTAVETTVITVERVFPDFEDFWQTALLGPSLAPALARMAADEVAAMREFVRARLPVADDGRVTLHARAHAVRGRVPG